MRRNNKNIYVVLVVVLLISITIGYAVINTTLNINGKSNISKNTWDIYFDNIKITNGSVTAVKIPTIEDSTTVDFEAQLNLPGDFYEFTVDVVNNGTIDAMIDSVEKTPDLTSSQQKYLNYIIEYQNGDQITTKQLVKQNGFVRLKVRVEYKKDISASDLPQTVDTLNLGFNINYVQSDGTGSTVTDNGAWVIKANGSLDDIGTIVTIGTEQFYTIGTKGDNVKLLSMMNITLDDNPIQSSSAGKPAFSNTSSTYEGSIVEGYVNNYKTEIEKLGIEVKESRLITYNEVSNVDIFACVDFDFCSDKYPWIYSTSFWLGSAYDTLSLWYVSSDGYFGNQNYEFDSVAGVRPVIVISKSDIVVNVKPVANGDINEIGTIVTLGTEQFYTIGTEGDNVKLLSMYNLYVGNSVAKNLNITPLASPTGKQSNLAKGWINDASEWYGITGFSSEEKHGTNYNDYSGSIVEGYVNNYKNIIETDYRIDIVEARLITYDELTDSETFACSEDDYSCINSPYPWIYSTTYWSGSALDVDYVWLVDSYGSFSDHLYDHDSQAGVRPVIVISKDNF